MSLDKAPVVIIGAGVVGCAIAQRLAAAGHAAYVLEKGPRIAEGITSRNSGVIHSGIYYPKDSLKALCCIRGKALLYEWCRAHKVPHRQTGKWVVGDREDRVELEKFYQNALACGATGLTYHAEIPTHLMPKGVRAQAGVYCAETGIVDPYELSRSLQIVAEEGGAEFLTRTAVTGATRAPGGYLLQTTRGEIEARVVINAAGLESDLIAKMIGIDRYQLYPWRGDYFKLRSSTKFDTLIYPVKKRNAPGLGVHLTLDLDGGLRLGPDVTFVQSREDFATPANVDQKRQAFFEAASKYLEGVNPEDLSYDTCGIRPKLRSPTDQEEKDFILSEDLPGWINLIGIESPGLTSALDIADRVLKLSDAFW